MSEVLRDLPANFPFQHNKMATVKRQPETDAEHSSANFMLLSRRLLAKHFHPATRVSAAASVPSRPKSFSVMTPHPKDILHKILPHHEHSASSSTHTKSPSHSRPGSPAVPLSPRASMDSHSAAEQQPRMKPNGELESKSEMKKRIKAEEKEKLKQEKENARLAREAEAKQQKQANEVDYSADNYGKLPLNMSQTRSGTKRISFGEITAANEGEKVVFRARLQTSRAQGAKMVFLVFRQQQHTIQALVQVEPELVSKPMVRWAESINPESIVLVEGTIQKPLDLVKSCTVQDAEVKISKLHVISDAPTVLPFSIADAMRTADSSEGAVVALDTRLDNRVLDLRTITNQSIFKMQSGICQLFRQFLVERKFVEIHTPKLQGAATESGSSVFKVSYFKGNAYLAQSPQLSKQMCIAADMERVFEIGPVFRAEDSNTHRHMTEFMGLDMEMAFEEHYHEVMETIDGMLKHIFAGLRQNYADEISIVQKQFPHENFTWLDQTLVLSYEQAIKMLQEAGVQQGTPPQLIKDWEDMSTSTEKALGVLVKEKYQTDYYIIDKFPIALRPFYTMPDPQNPHLSNSYDFFMRGEEILSGAQRLHDAEMLEQRMREVGIEPSDMESYCDAFRLGAPPHAGGGIGDPKRLDP